MNLSRIGVGSHLAGSGGRVTRRSATPPPRKNPLLPDPVSEVKLCRLEEGSGRRLRSHSLGNPLSCVALGVGKQEWIRRQKNRDASPHRIDYNPLHPKIQSTHDTQSSNRIRRKGAVNNSANRRTRSGKRCVSLPRKPSPQTKHRFISPHRHVDNLQLGCMQASSNAQEIQPKKSKHTPTLTSTPPARSDSVEAASAGLFRQPDVVKTPTRSKRIIKIDTPATGIGPQSAPPRQPFSKWADIESRQQDAALSNPNTATLRMRSPSPLAAAACAEINAELAVHQKMRSSRKCGKRMIPAVAPPPNRPMKRIIQVDKVFNPTMVFRSEDAQIRGIRCLSPESRNIVIPEKVASKPTTTAADEIARLKHENSKLLARLRSLTNAKS
eukprot:TRINITY_DN27646_c0_g1_i1.p1 TRINITY_DN27646_c0_g1~~TRINITY_DN27646_c0_g1_i1.p1  ORF type:complete len:383 (+),score=61.30 TRINITY_DN27646_c0_g1_i1:48-1196(+)